MITVNVKQTFEKAVAKAKEDARKQEKINERDNVISKYGKIFHPDNLDNLTKEDFKNFCKFEHNSRIYFRGFSNISDY